MMFKLMDDSLSFAPLAYLLSLMASILNKMSGKTFGFAEAALFASLPLVGMFAAIHSPVWDGATLNAGLLVGLAAFCLPSIVTLALLVWLGRD